MLLVETQKLRMYYPVLGGVFKRKVGEVKACDGIDLGIAPGEWFGLVGESGCGKTTLGKTILRLLKPTAGHIYFDVPPQVKDEIARLENSGHDHQLEQLLQEYDLARFSWARLKGIRQRLQLVQQDPATSLNPRMTVKDIVGEPLVVHRLMSRRRARDRVAELLPKVGLNPDHLNRYPHQFSGGQRQRVAIARALSSNPQFIVLDEPTSALDVSVQAQILSLLGELRRELKLTYLYITHDLALAEVVCDRIAVMYLGKIVEIALTTSLFQRPYHPYSAALVAAIPLPDPEKRRQPLPLPGEVPSPTHPPLGCRFHPRCSLATEECQTTEPPLEDLSPNHAVACWHPLPSVASS